jgi:hypothetical protein
MRRRGVQEGKSKLSLTWQTDFFAGLLYVEDRCIYRDQAEQVATTRQAQILKKVFWVVALYSKYTRALILCQACRH